MMRSILASPSCIGGELLPDPAAAVAIGQAQINRSLQAGSRAGQGVLPQPGVSNVSSGSAGTGCSSSPCAGAERAVLWPLALLQHCGQVCSLLCGSRYGAWHLARCRQPTQPQEHSFPSVNPLHTSGPTFSEPFPRRSGTGVCRGAARPRCRHWHICPIAPSRSSGRVPGSYPHSPALGAFSCCAFPVRFKVSYWTSLGNFNVLKRRIKKKEKEEPHQTQPLINPIYGSCSLTVWLYHMCRLLLSPLVVCLLSSILPLVLPPALCPCALISVSPCQALESHRFWEWEVCGGGSRAGGSSSRGHSL